ncbi:MAG: ubiquitin-like small modifier protein 2 [Halobacteriaceae archaeon]
MTVTVEVVGGDTHEVALESGTYADLLEAVGLSTQAAAVFVDDRPVPEDQPVETDHVRVVRLVSGG